MDPVSNADRLVRLIRQKLEERAKARGASAPSRAASIRAKGPETVRALAGAFAKGGADDQQLRRALVEQLLADQFGPGLINEAPFQQVVDQVKAAMETDPDIGGLIDAAIEKIRSG